jgi:FAD/FMN-containing dehydrogenase
MRWRIIAMQKIGTCPVDAGAVDSLRKRSRGAIVLPGENGYDQLREVWNGQIDRYPAVIARVACVEDIVSAVRFGREQELVVSVRGGGHSISGLAVCDGGLMIDCAAMRAVRVDPARLRAVAEPGATWGDFDYQTQAFGLATPGGTVTHTGIAGLTLGGGFGWLGGKHGLTCDNVRSFKIVTADGELLNADEEENTDLFWGLRGGGGNFGVVVEFEYDLHPVSEMYGGMILYPFNSGKDVFCGLNDVIDECPDELTLFGGILKAPDGTSVIGVILAYTGDAAAGNKAVDPFRKFATPMADLMGPIRYTKLQTLLDEPCAPHRRNYIKTNLLKDNLVEAAELCLEGYENVPSDHSMVAFQCLGNTAKRVANDATAFAHRDAKAECMILSVWNDASEDQEQIAWARSLSEKMEPLVSGHYFNHVGMEADEGVEKIAASLGDNFQRLTQIKAKYDPTNFFHHNQNIKPAL